MKKILTLNLLFASLLFGVNGEEVYKSKCASCHKLYIPATLLIENFTEEDNKMLNLKAPTINQIVFRLKSRIGDPKGDQDMQKMEVDSFIADYLIKPNRDKSICLPDVLKHFKTMPSMSGKITKDEVEAISDFLYSYDINNYIEKEIEFFSFENALKKAKKEHKLIMLELTRDGCHFCKKMEREILVERDVIEALDKEFISVKLNVEKDKLPLGLKKGMTPTFAFVNEHGELFSVIPGAWSKVDFLDLLEYIKKKSKMKREAK
jgi:thioredoxin-related protein